MSSTRTFTLKNTGTAPLDVESAAISPPTPQFVAVPSQSLPHTLDPDDEMTVDVTASSASEGSFTAELEVIHTGVNSPSTAPLSVNFISPPIGPGSMLKQNSGDTWGRIPGISAYILNDFTIQINVLIVASPSPANFGRILDSGPSGAPFVTNWQNSDRIAIEGSGIGLTSGTGVITQDTWYNLTMRRSGTTESILVNGVVVASGTVSSSVVNLDTPKVLYLGGPAEAIQAYYSDWRIWNIARSDAEVLGDYQQRLSGSETGLVLYYPLSENDSIFNDLTGNNVAVTLRTNTTIGVPVPGVICYDPTTPPWFP